MKTLHDMKEDFESFQNVTLEARLEAERDQDYDNHDQWSADDIVALDNRNQAAVVINRFKHKVNLLVGLQHKNRSKPKALPRTPEHEDGADAATEALRFVTDNNRFDPMSSAVFRDEIVPGYGGVIVETAKVNGKIEIEINQVPWDRYYYDPHSRRLDFADKKYDGIVLWIDRDDVKEAFPKLTEEIDNLFSAAQDSTGSETFDDKPVWVDKARKRIRVCQHYYLEEGTWKLAYFTDRLFLIEPHPSPYKDEFGKPTNPIEMQTAYIDRDLARYGEARSYVWLQDEINHRRSRLLYTASVRQVIYEEGAVDDITEAKQQLALSDGAIKVNPGRRFEFVDTRETSAVDFQLYQESKAEIDEIGANAALAGRVQGEVSGRALQIQQQGGIAELAQLYSGHKDWEQRVYRQIWNRVRQFWNKERWIRVTDDQSNLEWVGLNAPITNGELLQREAQKGSQDAQALLQQMLGDPRLNETAQVENKVAELDVDIILTEAPDFVTIRQEQFEMLAALGERYGPENVPFSAMLKLSDMPNKDEVIKSLEGDIDPQQQQAQVELQAQAAELQMRKETALVAKIEADGAKVQAEAEAQLIENEVIKADLDSLFADRANKSRKLEADADLQESKVIQTNIETGVLLRDDDPQAVVQT